MPLFQKNRENEIAVIGLGRFGGHLARRLESLGHPVLGIDIEPRLVKEISDEITEAVVLDATDTEALEQVDITSFHTVVVAIADNFEANALITATLKNLGIPTVIAEANSNRHREILLRIGADRVILPKEDSSSRLADELSIPGMLERLHLSQDFTMIEMILPNSLVGKTVNVSDKYEVIVVLIMRGEEIIINPDPNCQFLEDDILVLVGDKRNLATFSNME